MIEDKPETNEKAKNGEEVKPIFSDEEKRNTVKGFILSFIRQEIKISIVAESEPELAQALSQESIKKFTPQEEFERLKERVKYVANANAEFCNLVEICSGIKSVSSSELKVAFNKLFQTIIELRVGKRIEGTFWDYSLEQRLEKIEKKIQGDIDFLKREVRWLKEQLNV